MKRFTVVCNSMTRVQMRLNEFDSLIDHREHDVISRLEVGQTYTRLRGFSLTVTRTA